LKQGRGLIGKLIVAQAVNKLTAFDVLQHFLWPEFQVVFTWEFAGRKETGIWATGYY